MIAYAYSSNESGIDIDSISDSPEGVRGWLWGGDTNTQTDTAMMNLGTAFWSMAKW